MLRTIALTGLAALIAATMTSLVPSRSAERLMIVTRPLVSSPTTPAPTPESTASVKRRRWSTGSRQEMRSYSPTRSMMSSTFPSVAS